MSAGSGGGAAEAAEGRGGDPEASGGEAVKGGQPAVGAAQPAGEHSHESGATAAPCADDLRSNLSFRRRLSETEAAPADRAPDGTAAQRASPKAVVPQQAGAWSADEQQRWWQHLKVAVSVPMDAPDVAMRDAAEHQGGGPDAEPDEGEAVAKSASGLTHTDRTTQSDCSGPGSALGAIGADTAATAQSMRGEGRKRKVRPGRGPLPDRSPASSPLSPPRVRTYSLNDNAVHYGKGVDHAQQQQQQQQQPSPQNGFSPRSPGGDSGAAGFNRRSGGSESGGGGEGGTFLRRSGGSDPGTIGRRSSGTANAAHYAALEEKVQRRLRQNREAAQRSRQRKKAYMAALEAEIKSGKSQEEALAAVRPAKAPRRGGGGGGNRSPGSGGGGGNRSAFQVPGGPTPGMQRGEAVLDSLAAAAAVVSGNSVPMGDAMPDAGQPPSSLGRIRTSVGGTLQQALRGPLLPTPPAAMPLMGSGGAGAFQLPPHLPPQLAALIASAAGGPPEAALAALQMSGLPLQGLPMDPAVLGALAAAAAAQQQAARVAISLLPQPRQMSPHQLAPPQQQEQRQQHQHQQHHDQGSMEQPRLLQPPPDFAAAAVPAAHPQRSRSSLGRRGSGTPGGPPTITSGALGGGVAVNVAPRSSSFRNGHAAVDGLLAPLGSGMGPQSAPPQMQVPWPPAAGSQHTLPQEPRAMTPKAQEGRSPRGGASTAAPLGGASEASSDLKTEAPHAAQLVLPPTSAATMLAAFRMWRGNHAATAACVRRALEAGNSEELRPAVARAQAELAACFQLKAACLGSDDAHLVLAGEHLTPAERPYAWLGSQKASEAASALIARLGDDAPPALTRLQASLVEQERVLDDAHSDLMAAMRTHAATAAAAAALGTAGSSEGGGPSADDYRRVDALRELMLHPDRLWTHFLEETGNMLPQRHFALAVICRAETSAQLQRLHGVGGGLPRRQQ